MNYQNKYFESIGDQISLMHPNARKMVMEYLMSRFCRECGRETREDEVCYCRENEDDGLPIPQA